MRELAMVVLGLALAGPALSQVSGTVGEAVPTTIEAAYREAVRSSPVPQALADARDGWIENGARPDDVDYLDRLQAGIRQDRLVRSARPAPQSVMEACVAGPLKGCGVASAGVMTLDRTRRLWWQIQDGYTEEDGVGGGMMVFEQAGDGPLTPVVWAFEAGVYETPVLTRVDSGPLLVVPGVSRGTGAGDAGVLMIRSDAGWQPVDADWQDRAGPLLDGREVRHRPYWYWSEMLAMTPLWHSDDPQCCGRAGVALLGFDVVDGQLTLTRLQMLAPRDD